MSFDATQMLQDLDGGTLTDQLSSAIHEVAKSVVLNGDAKRKGKVTLELTFEQIRNASQVNIAHKLSYKQLTPKGDVSETRGDESPMHVTRTGVSVTPDGQFDFIEQQRVREESNQ